MLNTYQLFAFGRQLQYWQWYVTNIKLRDSSLQNIFLQRTASLSYEIDSGVIQGSRAFNSLVKSRYLADSRMFPWDAENFRAHAERVFVGIAGCWKRNPLLQNWFEPRKNICYTFAKFEQKADTRVVMASPNTQPHSRVRNSGKKKSQQARWTKKDVRKLQLPDIRTKKMLVEIVCWLEKEKRTNPLKIWPLPPLLS